MAALLELKAGLQDPLGSLGTWGAEHADGDPCGTPWPHLQCDGIHVVGLLLGHLGLRGTVSAALADMPRLRTIELHNNSLTGTIPVIAKPDGILRILWLFNNQLSGTLPQQVRARGLPQVDLGRKPTPPTYTDRCTQDMSVCALKLCIVSGRCSCTKQQRGPLPPHRSYTSSPASSTCGCSTTPRCAGPTTWRCSSARATSSRAWWWRRSTRAWAAGEPTTRR